MNKDLALSSMNTIFHAMQNNLTQKYGLSSRNSTPFSAWPELYINVIPCIHLEIRRPKTLADRSEPLRFAAILA